MALEQIQTNKMGFPFFPQKTTAHLGVLSIRSVVCVGLLNGVVPIDLAVGQKPIGSHFGVGAPPILDPIFAVGLGCSLGVRFGFSPTTILPDTCLNREDTLKGGAKKPELAKLLCVNSAADVETWRFSWFFVPRDVPFFRSPLWLWLSKIGLTPKKALPDREVETWTI